MTNPEPPFTQAEYDRRIRLTRQAMNDHEIEALFITDPSNQAWLTGYDGWSFYVHQGVILGLDGEPIWWGRNMDANGAHRTVWMDTDCILAYADHFVMSTAHHPMEDLAKHLIRLGCKTSRIGIEMENYYYSAKAHQVLTSCLSSAKFKDATGLVNWQRVTKSEQEITFMRRAASIAEKVVMTAIHEAQPGKPKNELVGDILKAGIYGVDSAWGDYPAIVPMTPSGVDTSAAHLTWNGEPMKSGEATFFELAGCYRRYHIPYCRTVFLGQPPKKMLNTSIALVDAIHAGIDVARSGNRACDIANALHRELSRAGIDRSGRCGYSIGLSYPPDWGERTISLRPEDQTVLEPGMTLHFMPGLWMNDWGIEITEPILITPEGPAETFCSIERKLFIKN